MPYDDDCDPTQFDPSPWGSRQRVLPRRTFKAVASVVAQVPSLAAHVARAEAPAFGTPIVREADIPTWRVPKLALYPTKPRARLDLRLWLPIGGLVSIVIIALLGARLGGDLRADATSISAALLGESGDARFHLVANVEEPPAPPAAPRPAAVAKPRHAPVRVAHAAKRPRLAVDVTTPLGDLARERRR